MVLEPLVIHLKHNTELNVKKETLKFYKNKKILNAFRPWCGERLSSIIQNLEAIQKERTKK